MCQVLGMMKKNVIASIWHGYLLIKMDVQTIRTGILTTTSPFLQMRELNLREFT